MCHVCDIIPRSMSWYSKLFIINHEVADSVLPQMVDNNQKWKSSHILLEVQCWNNMSHHYLS